MGGTKNETAKIVFSTAGFHDIIASPVGQAIEDTHTVQATGTLAGLFTISGPSTPMLFDTETYTLTWDPDISPLSYSVKPVSPDTATQNGNSNSGDWTFNRGSTRQVIWRVNTYLGPIEVSRDISVSSPQKIWYASQVPGTEGLEFPEDFIPYGMTEEVWKTYEHTLIIDRDCAVKPDFGGFSKQASGLIIRENEFYYDPGSSKINLIINSGIHICGGSGHGCAPYDRDKYGGGLGVNENNVSDYDPNKCKSTASTYSARAGGDGMQVYFKEVNDYGRPTNVLHVTNNGTISGGGGGGGLGGLSGQMAGAGPCVGVVTRQGGGRGGCGDARGGRLWQKAGYSGGPSLTSGDGYTGRGGNGGSGGSLAVNGTGGGRGGDAKNQSGWSASNSTQSGREPDLRYQQGPSLCGVGVMINPNNVVWVKQGTINGAINPYKMSPAIAAAEYFLEQSAAAGDLIARVEHFLNNYRRLSDEVLEIVVEGIGFPTFIDEKTGEMKFTYTDFVVFKPDTPPDNPATQINN